MKLLELFVVSSIPVLKAFRAFRAVVGSILATDYVNLLGENARTYFNGVVFYVFNPSLIATNLAKTVTVDSIIKLWFMPLNILLTFIIGSAFGWIVIQLIRAPSHLRGLILGCCPAGNLGNMLFAIIPVVCKDKGSPPLELLKCATPLEWLMPHSLWRDMLADCEESDELVFFYTFWRSVEVVVINQEESFEHLVQFLAIQMHSKVKGGDRIYHGVRTVYTLPITFSINSICHTWGKQVWNTGDMPRNNWLLGLLAHGEGWHNNYHAFKYSADKGWNGRKLTLGV